MRFPVVYWKQLAGGTDAHRRPHGAPMEELRDKLANLVEHIAGIMVRL